MKNLEDEYRRFHQEETPDLWNRIEAGLTDKEVKHKKSIFHFKYASVCVAAVLLVALLPGIYFFGKNGRNATNGAQQNMTPQAGGSGAADICSAAEDRDGAAEDVNGTAENVNGATEDSDFACQPDGSALTGAADDGEAASFAGDEEASDSAGAGEAAGSSESCEPEKAEQDAVSDCASQELNGEARDGEMSGMPAEEKEGSMADDNVPQAAKEPAAPLFGAMEVTKAEQKNERTVYYLCTEDGQIVSAVPAEDLQAVFQTGKTYLFTLKPSEEEAWDYIIETAE